MSTPSGSPAEIARRRSGRGRSEPERASIRYSVGAWQRMVTPSRSATSSRPAGSNRASTSSAAAPITQGATKTLRADFDHPVAVVTQTRSSSVAADPVLGLVALCGQVARGVEGRPRLARGARGEHDQCRVGGSEVGVVGRRLLRLVLVERRGDVGQGHAIHAAGHLGEKLLLADAERRVGDADPVFEVPAAKLGVARQRNSPHAPAREHREHPFHAVAHQGHHHVSPAHSASCEGAGQPRGAGVELAQVPHPALAVGGDRHEGRLRGRP